MTETNDGTCLVLIGASWCGPCKKLKSTITGLMLSAKLDAKVVMLDVDDDEEECSELEITKIPTSLFLVQGQEKERHIGIDGYQKFLQKCATHLAFENHFP